MKTTTLGAKGPEITQFGLGAMSFAGAYGGTTQETSNEVLDACFDAGVTHLDTANIYGEGRSEEICGAWLRDRPGMRYNWKIATKAGIVLGDPERRFNNEGAYLEAELDGSLKRLGVEYVDLFYVHRREAAIPIAEVAGSLGRLVEKGKVKGIGFSEIAPNSLREAHAEFPVTAVQSEYSLSTRVCEMGLVQTCGELGVTLVAFSPVGRSYLTDAPFTRADLESIPFLSGNPRFMEPNYSKNLEAVKPFLALAREMGEPAAALAVAWCRAKGDHVVPIPGTKSVPHLGELIRGAELELSEAQVAAIEAALPLGWAHGDRYNETQWVGPEKYG